MYNKNKKKTNKNKMVIFQDPKYNNHIFKNRNKIKMKNMNYQRQIMKKKTWGKCMKIIQMILIEKLYSFMIYY